VNIKIISIILLSALSIEASYSQILESELNPDGIVFPRMDEVQRDALNAMEGQCIYNTDTNRLNCYDGNNWNKTKHISIPATEAVYDENLNIGVFGTFYNPGASDMRSMVFPVIIPDGVILKSITFYYTDTNPNNQIRFIFNETLLSINGGFATVGFSNDGTYESFTLALNNKIVDNSKFTYSLGISPMDLPLDNSIVFHGVSIEYIEN